LNNLLRFESVERSCPSGSYFDASRSECAVNIQATRASANLLSIKSPK
jgi:hypothetical protein